MLLKAYKTGITFQQMFTCEIAYNKRAEELRSMGFILASDLVH